jgi:hypothetical protein
VATLGINPSNREFVDLAGRELTGAERRFHTLSSLGLESWRDADSRHLRLLHDSCRDYFSGQPYDRWFRILDTVIGSLDASYYGTTALTACHLDLIPYATADKWTSVPLSGRKALLRAGSDALASTLRDSQVRVLVLNGQAVVEHFRDIFGVVFSTAHIKAWDLPRSSGSPVAGIAYKATVAVLGGQHLDREIVILGYNHNLQSSFGVTASALRAIRSWIGTAGGTA